MTTAQRDRLFDRLTHDPVTRCLVWSGPKVQGYGYATIEGRKWRVHRLMYELFAGPIPPGHEIDHLCRNRACANVAHLEAVTPRENRARIPREALLHPGVSAAGDYQRAKTACPAGHAYDMIEGGRRCRACRREQWRRSNAKRRSREKT